MNSSHFGFQQTPTEFADYLVFLSRLKIETAVEIGVFAGATAYFSAAVLQRVNPNLTYTLVDIPHHLSAFDEFQELLKRA